MSEFRAEKEESNERAKNLSTLKPASEITVIPEANDRLPPAKTQMDWRARLKVIQLEREEKERLGKIGSNGQESKIPSEIEIPEIAPTTEEKIVEAASEQVDLEKMTESFMKDEITWVGVGVRIEDKDVLKKVFIDNLHEHKAFSLDELRDSIRDAMRAIDHLKSKLGSDVMLRREKLKSASSEELERRRKEDFEYFSPKGTQVKTREKKQGVVAKKKDTTEAIRDGFYKDFISKGLSEADAKAKADAKFKKFLALE